MTVTADARPGVLMVTGAYFPELSGGGLQAKALVDTLGGEIRFTVLTTATDESLPADDTVDGTPVHRVHVRVSSGWSKLAAIAAMARAFFAVSASIDLVHLHGFSQKSILLVVLAKLLGKPIVLTLHTAGQDEPASVRRQGRLAAWAYGRADLFLAISAPLAESLSQAGVPSSRIVTVSNGLDVARFRPVAEGERAQLRRALGLPADRTLILFAGLFTVDKGPQVLFEAWRRLAAGPAADSTLVYVGAIKSRYYEVDASLASGIKAAAQRDGLADRVLFAGETRIIDQYYRAADLFVFPTRREAFGMALVEAMASGLPCVASRLPGVTDDIVTDEESGLLVPPHDVDALSAALARVLSDRALAARLGRAARQAVDPRFAIEHTSRRTFDAYRRLLPAPLAAGRPA